MKALLCSPAAKLMLKWVVLTTTLLLPRCSFAQTHAASDAQTHRASELKSGFESPPPRARPETWFHLIGGNVDQKALTTDLEAVAGAGIGGIQLFHGRGRAWPGVQPQIQTLSPTWDSLISHVADETQRLGLKFTMQNCPGWAMSGGPWITPDNAMRHLITSRQNIVGGKPISIDLDVPQPSKEDWRNYQDIAVLAFPTPIGDSGTWVRPDTIETSLNSEVLNRLIDDKPAKLQIPVASDQAHWIEFTFADPITLRSMELPPTEHLMKRRSFDPDSIIEIQVGKNQAAKNQAAGQDDTQWQTLVTHLIPRGNWQDRQSEVPLVMAIPDARSDRYRILFRNQHPMELSQLRLSTAARVHDWRSQAGYVLRSLDRQPAPVQVPASFVSLDSVIDLSDRVSGSGHLDWDAPDGDWTVVRFGHVNTGVTNKPAPPEATGFECDKLSPLGAEQHFAGYIGRLSKTGGAADAGRLEGMLIDSWECYTQTWTPEMERAFQTRRGYPLRRWMPALAGWVVQDHRSSERFLRDWRATISDLIVENYYGRLAELGRERGLQLSYETAVGDVSPGDIMQYFKSADIPMCEVWQPNDPHDGGLETKPIAPTASAAHIYGKPRVAAEAFTTAPMNWKEHPFALKNVADRSFALGVTHMVFHTYTHNPGDRVPGTSFGNTIGAPFLRAQTWWKYMPEFTDYLARCGFLLEQGRSVADVLWYLGDDVDHKPRQDSPFPSGYHFDYLNADALQNRMSIQDGDFVNPEGNRWKVLWLPNPQCRRMTPQTLQRIKRLLQDGATVIGEAPTANPSLMGGEDADAQFDELVDELWGEETSEGQRSSSGERRIGTGRLVWGGDLKDSLAELGITPDVTGTLAERWCHRTSADAEIYFVIGDREQSIDANLHFRCKGRPELWNPIDGSVTPIAAFKTTEIGTIVPVRLPVAGSTFVVFRRQPATPRVERIAIDTESNGSEVVLDVNDRSRIDKTAGYPPYGVSRTKPIQPWVSPAELNIDLIDGGRRMIAWKDGRYRIDGSDGETKSVAVSGTQTIPLRSNWKLTFASDTDDDAIYWGVPDSIALDEIGPWSAMADDEVRHYSGTASYETSFTLDEFSSDDRILLELGQVGDIARIMVNGQDTGVIWTWPFRQDITDVVRKGRNDVSVAVTNTWHNRLAYDARFAIKKRKTWTISGPPKEALLEFSGLSRNVQLRRGKVVSLAAEQ